MNRSKCFFVVLICLFSFIFVLEQRKCLGSELYDEVVSLGSRCQVAIQTEQHGWRKRAYPFDWLIVNQEGLLSFLANEGKNFLDRDKLQFLAHHPGVPHLHVLDTRYKFLLYHDFLAPTYLSNYDQVKIKYDRRIKRFFELLKSNKKVLFIRVDITRHQAEELDHLLHTLYPSLSYTLIALNNTEDFKNDWGLERIRNFFIPLSPQNWQGDDKRWREILNKFPIVPLKGPRPAEERW